MHFTWSYPVHTQILVHWFSLTDLAQCDSRTRYQNFLWHIRIMNSQSRSIKGVDSRLKLFSLDIGQYSDSNFRVIPSRWAGCVVRYRQAQLGGSTWTFFCPTKLLVTAHVRWQKIRQLKPIDVPKNWSYQCFASQRMIVRMKDLSKFDWWLWRSFLIG